MGKLPDMEVYAKRWGKHDLDRLGLFIEMPYLPAKGMPLKAKKKKKEAVMETERTMLAGGPKTKCGNQDGYFESQFGRLYKGEGPGKPKKFKSKKETTTPFIPTGPSKKHSCPGDYFGTFAGFISEFSPKQRPKPKYKPEPPNAVTNPGKKGGPGYIAITIGRYPTYKGGRPRKEPKPAKPRAGPMITMHFPQPYFEINPYRDPKKDPPTRRLYIKPIERVYFDKKSLNKPIFVPTGPTKWEGGCKAGMFSKWPEWKKDKYLSLLQQDKVLSGKEIPFRAGPFQPPSSIKNQYTTSLLYHTNFSMNSTNWKVYEPKYVKRLVKDMF